MSDQYIALFNGYEQDDSALIAGHLDGLDGPVLDLGCGPGHWTAYLHARGTDVAAFDHKVFPAYRWPVDEFSARLTGAGFTELEHRQKQFPERPDRKYAAMAARAA